MVKTSFLPEEIVLQKEEFAYGFIIEVLTRGLYPNKFHVLREYIQNAYDAILTWRKKINDPAYGKISIKIASPSIVIYDDGTGMDWTKINQYRYIGYSEKKTGEGVGFRGIGKLSGISVADKLIITTSPAGKPERYQLVFDANSMLTHMMALKQRGENMPLNELITKHTSLNTDYEDIEKHYTMVELYNIKTDSKPLMDEEQITEYLGMNAPLAFDPGFSYGKIIDKWLRKYVCDYDTVPLELDGKCVYKPFLPDISGPQHDFVLADDSLELNITNREEPLAFYWFCEHASKGQFPEKSKRGLSYRVKNFTVGTNQLPRITLWRASPERAYYFWGEIHICDPEMIPSSDRENFEQNDARDRFYQEGTRISRKLNILAGESSAKRSSREFIERAESIIQEIQNEADEGRIAKELKFDKMFKIRAAILKVSERLNDAPTGFEERGQKIIDRGNTLVKNLENDEIASATSSPIYDIRKKLHLSEDAIIVYEVIIKSIQEELIDKPDLFERVIKRIHAELGNLVKPKSTE